MINEVLLNELERLDWVDILKVLTAYAVFKTSWKNIPNCKEPKDYAQEAVKKLFEGERKWNKEKYPDIRDFLKGAVDSLISNEFRSIKNKDTLNLIDNSDYNIQDTYPSNDLSADKLLELEQEENDLREEIQNAIKGDDNLELYFMYLEEDYKPSEFSKKFDIDIKDVYNLIRKLRRITRNILKKRKITQNE